MRSLRSPLDVFLHLKRQPQLLRTFLYAINIVYVMSKYYRDTVTYQSRSSFELSVKIFINAVRHKHPKDVSPLSA